MWNTIAGNGIVVCVLTVVVGIILIAIIQKKRRKGQSKLHNQTSSESGGRYLGVTEQIVKEIGGVISGVIIIYESFQKVQTSNHSHVVRSLSL